MQEAQGKANYENCARHLYHERDPPKYTSYCSHMRAFECLRYTNGWQCPYSISTTTKCKDRKLDHLNLPCRLSQSQSSCSVPEQDAHMAHCSSACLDEPILRRTHGCDRNAFCYCHSEIRRTPRSCCSNCRPCPIFPLRCPASHKVYICFHGCPHYICCKFH
jgi:hypothetical protein